MPMNEHRRREALRGARHQRRRVFMCAGAVALAVLMTGGVTGQSSNPAFRHRVIDHDVPGANRGLGGIGVADFDRDGRLDVVVFNRGDNQVYWFAREESGEWTRYPVGPLPVAQLGIAIMDVDGDGWPDVLFGGVWFRNSQQPKDHGFTPHHYDRRIRSEIHDLAIADVDGNGTMDLVALGDGEGLYWYAVPDEPTGDADWPRHTITLDVLNEHDDIHGGFAPGGLGDLDGDGDVDIVLADRWLENQQAGTRWVAHTLWFGRRGPWGVSARSWVADVNGDGHNDIVMADSDGQNSGVAWLENDGGTPPRFRPHYLPNRASGTRGSFHSLWYGDFNGDGLKDILVVEQEAPDILPVGAGPRWFLFQRQPGPTVEFVEHVIFEGRLGGHDVRVADMDGDGDLDIVSKVWSPWPGNANGGRAHIDLLENLSR